MRPDDMLGASDERDIADIVMVGWLPRRIAMEDMSYIGDPTFVLDVAIGSIGSALSATDQ
jgi:hypothetical protein